MCNGRAEGERDARRRKKAPTAQQRNAREPRGAYPARAEMDFGIGIVGSQEAASFPHTLKVNMWKIKLCIAMSSPLIAYSKLTLWFNNAAFFLSH
jgi:hypothetical protein